MIITKESMENKVIKTYLVKTTTKTGGGYGVYLTSFDEKEIESLLLNSGDTINKLEFANEGMSKGHWFVYKNKRYDMFKDENRLKNHLKHLLTHYLKDFTYRAILINENSGNVEFYNVVKGNG